MAAAWSRQSSQFESMNWYCVHTKPQREKQVVEQLGTVLGFEVYFPLLQLQKTIRRVRRKVTEPLFPRYLFCHCDINSSYRSVRYAHDVVNLVSFGEHPAMVQDQLIDNLRSWTNEHRPFVLAEPTLSSGDTVEITDGPMQGLQAIILDARNDSERVAVLLSILGCDARLTIDRCQLAKAV